MKKLLVIFISCFLLSFFETNAQSIDSNQSLKLLPENNRYFEYRGLPFMPFGYAGGFWEEYGFIPRVGLLTEDHMDNAARYGNHIYARACTGSYDTIHLDPLKYYERKVFWKTYDNIWINYPKKHFFY